MWREAAVQCEAAFALDLQHVASAYAWAQDPEAAQVWAQIAQHLSGAATADSAHEGNGPDTAED